jgi:hypothetical protein
MKILNKSSFALLIVILLISISCNSFLDDVNTDPNNPTDVPVTVLLPAIEVRLAFSYGGQHGRIPAHFVGYYSGHRNQQLRYDQWDIQLADPNNLWNSLYAGVLQDIKEMELRAEASGDNAYVGIGRILSAYTWAMITDNWGDVPFEESLRIDEIVAPGYDLQEDIYPQIITLIDSGIVDLSQDSPLVPAGDDFIYGGDLSLWVKFANSLKLRLLNRLSKRDPNAAFAFLNSGPDLISSNAENAEHPFLSASTNENPIYQFDNLSGFQDGALSNFFFQFLESRNDPRIPYFFEPVINAPNAGMRLGKQRGLDDDDSGRGKYSRIGAAYAAADAPVPFMTYAQVEFLRAEILLRAGNSGEAQLAYENAVRADLRNVSANTAGKREINLVTATDRGETLGEISESDIEAYLAQSEVSWDGSLQRIMEQKYIANFGAPAEGWHDWKRTGFPVLNTPIVTFTNGVVPRKLPLPLNEINFNNDNLEAGPGAPVKDVSLVEPAWWDE